MLDARWSHGRTGGRARAARFAPRNDRSDDTRVAPILPWSRSSVQLASGPAGGREHSHPGAKAPESGGEARATVRSRRSEPRPTIRTTKGRIMPRSRFAEQNAEQ